LDHFDNESASLYKIDVKYDTENDAGVRKHEIVSFTLRGNDNKVAHLGKLKFTTSGENEFTAVSIDNNLNVNPVVKSKTFCLNYTKIV
jgi:hypothetical protein